LLFILLHFNLLVQCTILRAKLSALDTEIEKLHTDHDKDFDRRKLDSFPFTQMLAAWSLPMRELVTPMTWISFVAVPLVMILLGQWTSLPYHSRFITSSFQLFVTLDIIIILFIWTSAQALEAGQKDWSLLQQSKNAAGILGHSVLGNLSDLSAGFLHTRFVLC
jgi:hypothetical protein